MRSTDALATCLFSLAALASGCRATEPSEPVSRRPPNLILVVADDLGWADLGCYGQQVLQTPRLDALAAEGLRFPQFYAGSTVCAPSRCVLMTAKHTGRCEIRGNAPVDLPASEVTLAEVLKGAGYATGLFGKWGLGTEGGEGHPLRQGFDAFYGYLDQVHAHNDYPSFLIDGDERVATGNVVPNEGKRGGGVASERVAYAQDLILDRALEFVRANEARPFFLALTTTLPHANNEAGRHGMDGPDRSAFEALDWPEPEKGFAAMVARIDADVGRIVDLVTELGIERDTIVLFTSDNGPHAEGGHDPDFFDSNGPLSGIKRDLTEGGIRVPLIAWAPGRVPAGSLSGFVGGFQDLVPTFAELAGASAPADVDGLSFAPLLRGETRVARDHDDDAPLYWAFYERGGAQALRSGRWKVVQQPIASEPRLFDLAADPGETRDLAAERPELLAELVERMRAEYVESERWRFR